MTKRSDIKLIALDMDGTLLNSNLEVSERNTQAIQKAMDKGVQVMLSTGRRFLFCYPYAESLGLNTYLITANGGEIWTAEKTLLERHLLDPQVMEEICALGREFGLDAWLVATDHLFTKGEVPEDFMAYEWLKVGFSTPDLDKLAKMQEKLSKYEGLELTNSLPTNIEVNPIGVNKATGLESVCKEMGIAMEQVMAIGDSLNDIKMIAEVGLGVAMGNAQERVKAVAKHTTADHNEDGVGKAIERFIL